MYRSDMNTPTDGEVLLPCPLCAKKADLSDEDTLHPSGISWYEDPQDGIRCYVGTRSRPDATNLCWAMCCPTPAGGCGMRVTGDTREEAIAKWNTRPAPQAGEAVAWLELSNGEVLNAVSNKQREWALKNGYEKKNFVPCYSEPAATQAEAKDAARLDWLEAQWQNGIHVEVCAAFDGLTWHSNRRAATVFNGKREFKDNRLRAAIDAAMSEGEVE